jgi:long-chain acyl-CoA synthetase
LVVGPERKFVGALIVPSMNAVKDWMKQNNIEFITKEEAVKNNKVIEFFHSIVEEYNKLFNHVEQIKKFELLPNEWGIDTGEMTPKMSLKRKVITEKYKDAIERIYADC